MRTQYEKRVLRINEFGDARLSSRMDKIINCFSQNLSASIPQSCSSKAESKAAYRFFKNPQVSPCKMIAHHYKTFESQLSGMECVLHLMDTVEFDYTSKRSAKNLGPMNYMYRRGFYQHNSILLTEQGAPLGLFEQSYVIRNSDSFSKAAERKNLPLSEKESYRWFQHFSI